MARLAISLAGAAIGNAIAPGIGASIGFGIGAAAGSILFPEEIPTQYGPKLEDGTVSTSAYGTMIPKVYGTISVSGNIIDSGALVTVSHKDEVGGKGGPTQTVVTYTQFMDYAVGLCDGADGIVQIFANEKLIYDASPTAAVQRPEWLSFVFYSGSETQDVDPTFETNHGADGLPGYRGVAYVVFKQFKVSEFGSTAINFRFVVTSNATASTAEWVYTQTDEGTSSAVGITHNSYADLMIASVTHATDAGDEPRTEMVVAYDPYGRTQVWSYYQEDPTNYGAAGFVDSFSFYAIDSSGIPVYQPNQFVAVFHRGESFTLPRKRYLTLLYADSGAFLGRVEIEDSDSSMHFVSAYDDDAVFFQGEAPPGIGANSLHRISLDVSLAVTAAELVAPTGYQWGTETRFAWAKRGRRSTDTNATILLAVENSTTGAYGCVVFEDFNPGDGATTYTPSYSIVDEFASASGQPAGAVYDEDLDCFWVLFKGSSNTQIARVSSAGVIVSETDWNTSFTISGSSTGNGQEIVYDAIDGLLWVVISGAAYAWDTSDVTVAPVSYGSGLLSTALAYHPYTGTLWHGDPNDPEYTQNRLKALSGAGVSLQSIVEDICDDTGTNLLTGDRDATALSSITVPGFRINRVMQRRAAINELTVAYLWDFVPRAGVLTAILRGGASAATLDDDELGAHVYGGSAPPRISISRAAEESLPKLVGVSFIDQTQNYEPGYEAATRQASYGGTDKRIELGVVLSHDDAAQLSSILLHAAHIEAETYEASCMPSTLANVQPAGIITANINGTTYPMRINTASIVDSGIININGLRYDASVYTDYAAGGTTRDRTLSIDSIGTTKLFLLDLPALRDADYDAGLYLAGNTYSPAWDGAQVFSSVNGVDYSPIQVLATRATAGYLQEALPVGLDNGLDFTNTIKVNLISGSLASASHETFSTDKTANIAAVGSAGRWEILRFQTASQDGDGLWNLSGLHRHLRDSVDSADDHAAGDAFVLLNTSALRRAAIETSDIGSLRYYKAVSIGRNIAQTVPVTMTPTAAALKCFRPACLDADAGSPWDLSWTRQDKQPAAFLQQPVQSEDTESYTLDILDAGGGVVRTETASTQSYSYSTGQQTTDFGGTIDYVKWRVAQVSAVTGTGPYAYAASGSFPGDYAATVTARGSLIEYWEINEDGTGAPTIASDSGSHDGTGVAPINYNQAAICYDGEKTVQTTGAGRIDIGAWASMANVKCIEFWFNFSAVPSSTATLWNHETGGNGWHLYMTSSGNIGFQVETSSSTLMTLTSTTTYNSGTLHVVVNFDHTSGGTGEMYVNGAQVKTGTLSGTVTLASTYTIGSGSTYWSQATDDLDRYHNKLAFYSSKLTQAEIYTDALMGFGPL